MSEPKGTDSQEPFPLNMPYLVPDTFVFSNEFQHPMPELFAGDSIQKPENICRPCRDSQDCRHHDPPLKRRAIVVRPCRDESQMGWSLQQQGIVIPQRFAATRHNVIAQGNALGNDRFVIQKP